MHMNQPTGKIDYQQKMKKLKEKSNNRTIFWSVVLCTNHTVNFFEELDVLVSVTAPSTTNTSLREDSRY